VIRIVPADRVLTETDAPFADINNRTSEPRDVTAMIARLAELRNVGAEEMKRTIASNAERVLTFAGVSIPVAGR
jgi:TatD DNase family protein